MANHGFSTSPTPALIFKVMGTGAEWTHQQRLNCYIAAASGDLPDNVANAFFVSTLNTLGIAMTDHAQVIGKKIAIDTFAANGITLTKLTETDKRKAVAAVMWKDQDVEVTHVMLAGVTGEALDQMYASQCKPKDEAPFFMYRLRIGSHVIFRVTNEAITLDSLARQAIKYLVDTRKVPEADWSKELIS